MKNAVAIILSFYLISSCGLINDEKEIRQGIYLFPSGLDPAKNKEFYEYQIYSQIYEPLLTLDRDYKTLLPCLAETWSMSENKLVYTFHLRQGIRFHDGSLLTADAVQYSFTRQLRLRPDYPLFNVIDTISSIDSMTLEITLKYPYLPFLYSLASPNGLLVISKKALEKHGDDIDRHPVGTGPFYLDKWEEDKSITLAAYPEYRENSTIDKVIFQLPDSVSQAEIMFRDGKLDVLYMVAGQWLNRLKWLGTSDYYVQKSLNTIYIGFNPKNNPVDNIKVRKAILRGIDIKRSIYISNRGNALPAYNPIPPIFNGFDDLKQDDYNPEISKRLLRESGFENGLELNLNVFSPSSSRQIKVELIRSQLEKVGIMLNTKFFDDWELFKTSLKAKTCHLFLDGYGCELIGDPGSYLFALFHSNSPFNETNFSDTRVDSLLEQAFKEEDPQKRHGMYRSIVKIVLMDTPAVYDSHVKSVFAYNLKKIKSLVVNPYEFIYYHRLEIYE